MWYAIVIFFFFVIAVRCFIALQLLNKLPLVAWVAHDGNPKERACLVWARDEDEARGLVYGYYDAAFLRVARVTTADRLLGDRKEPGICDGEGSTYLSYLIHNGDVGAM